MLIRLTRTRAAPAVRVRIFDLYIIAAALAAARASNRLARAYGTDSCWAKEPPTRLVDEECSRDAQIATGIGTWIAHVSGSSRFNIGTLSQTMSLPLVIPNHQSVKVVYANLGYT